MNISSSAFKSGEYIPKKYSKRGGNVSPPLSFSDLPANTKSLALICHDPDAPGKDGFTHWVVWNINPEIKEIYEGILPAGAVQGTSDWNSHDWGGPQPPSGTHRYNFHLYALDKILDLPLETDRIGLEKAMSEHVIESAVLTGLFGA